MAVIRLVQYTCFLGIYCWIVLSLVSHAQTEIIQHYLSTVRTRYMILVSAISLRWGYLGMAVIRLVEYTYFLGTYFWIVLSLVSQRTDSDDPALPFHSQDPEFHTSLCHLAVA